MKIRWANKKDWLTIARLGLSDYFEHIKIVSEKTERFLMAGSERELWEQGSCNRPLLA